MGATSIAGRCVGVTDQRRQNGASGMKLNVHRALRGEAAMHKQHVVTTTGWAVAAHSIQDQIPDLDPGEMLVGRWAGRNGKAWVFVFEVDRKGRVKEYVR